MRKHSSARPSTHQSEVLRYLWNFLHNFVRYAKIARLPRFVGEAQRLVVPADLQSRQRGAILRQAVDELIDVDFRRHLWTTVLGHAHHKDPRERERRIALSSFDAAISYPRQMSPRI